MTPNVIPAVWLGVKVLVLIGLAVYAVFAGIMVRQEQLMANVLEESFEPVLRLIVIIHLAAAIGVFLLALFLL
ncbi:hypothetical protein HY950_01235 [Candidatus Gottesmanbacteria bacterium]|nr:hypothetical protein [Candidatus Gottesmanbacteria bacterium]